MTKPARVSTVPVRRPTFRTANLIDGRGEIDGNALRLLLQQFTGQRGNAIDRMVTVRDLADLGLIELKGNNLAPGSNASLEFLYELASDGLLTVLEKPTLLREYYLINSERARMNLSADYYGIVTEKNAYNTAFDDLNAYLDTLTEPEPWDSILGNTKVDGETLRTKFYAVHDARAILQEKIAEVAGTRADWSGVNDDNGARPEDYATRNKVFRQPTEPGLGAELVRVGDFWFDTDDDNHQYWYDGFNWVDLQDGKVLQALQDAAYAQSTADGKIQTFYQTTPPLNQDEANGDIWFDTDDGNTIYTYFNGAWTLAQDTDIPAAIAAAQNAQTTADGKAVVYYQNDPPLGLGAGDMGDMWVDTNDNNTLYVWNGSAWILAQDWYSASLTAEWDGVSSRPPNEDIYNTESSTPNIWPNPTFSKFVDGAFVGWGGTANVTQVTSSEAKEGATLGEFNGAVNLYAIKDIPLKQGMKARVRARYRATENSSAGFNKTYIGLLGVDATGTAINYTYPIVSAHDISVADGWQVVDKIYDFNNGYSSNTVSLRPRILTSYTQTGGKTQFDYISVEPIDEKLDGIEDGATVGADWGINLGQRPLNLTQLGGNESLLNDDLVLNTDGTLYDAGAQVNRGVVTIGGLGYNGDLNATLGATWGVDINGDGIPDDNATASPDDQVIFDPDFTKSLVKGLGVFWTSAPGVSVTNEGENGTTCLRIDANGTTRFIKNIKNGTDFYIPTLQGSRLYFRARVFVSNDFNGNLKCRLDTFTRADTNYYLIFNRLDNITKGSWQTLSGFVEVDNAGSFASLMRISMDATATTGYVLVSLYEVGRSPLNYQGDLNATLGADWGINLGQRPLNLTQLGGNESLLNDDLVLNTDGTLFDAGAQVNRGVVTIGGLGYSGDLNATYGATAAQARQLGRATTVFMETFDTPESLQDWDSSANAVWTTNAGSNVFKRGGGHVRVGDNAGNDQLWTWSNQRIPYDPDLLYKITVYAYKNAGTGTAYFGVTGFASDQTTFVNVTGADFSSNQHYVAASAVNVPSTLTKYVGYFSGHAASGNGGVHPNPEDPATLHNDVRFFSPMFLVNYSGQPGQTFIDAVIVEAFDKTTMRNVHTTIVSPAQLADGLAIDQGDGIFRRAPFGLGSGVVRDGGSVTFSTAFNTPPIIKFRNGVTYSTTLSGKQNLVTKAINVSTSGFDCSAKVKELAGSVALTTDTGATANVSGYDWVMHKSQSAQAYDDSYTFQFDVSVTNSADPENPGSYFPGNVKVGIYTNDGSGWVKRGEKTIGGSFNAATTTKNNETQTVVVDGLTNHAGQEFAVDVISTLYGGSITAFDNVKYSTATAPAEETATPTGAEDLVFELLAGE